jgi:chaperonin GroES
MTKNGRGTAVVEKSLAEKYRCLNEQVIVRRLQEDQEFAAPGVLKPEVARERSQRGLVVVSQEADIKVGDVVIFTKHGGTDLKLDGEELVLCHRKQIYVVEIAG